MTVTVLSLYMFYAHVLVVCAGRMVAGKWKCTSASFLGWNHGRDSHHEKGSQHNGYYNYRPRSDSMQETLQETFAAYFVDTL